MVSRCGAWVVAAFLFGACDAADASFDDDTIAAEETAEDDADGPYGEVTVDVEEGLAAAHRLTGLVTEEAQTNANIAVEGVFMASQTADTGQIVTTGTLTQQGPEFAWDPEPADRMVLAFADGTTIQLWIDALEGDPTSAAAFLGGDHRLTYTVKIDGRIDMRFSSVRSRGTIDAGARGVYLFEGTEYDVDLGVAGTTSFESDATGTRSREEHRTTGSVIGSEFDLDVDEGWTFEIVTAGNASAQSTRRTVSSSLRLGTDTYD